MPSRDVVFVLFPRFSMIALFGALEPLRVANRFAGAVFSWRFVSADGEPVTASNDIPVSVTSSIREVGRPDLATAEKGAHLLERATESTVEFLRDFKEWPLMEDLRSQTE